MKKLACKSNTPSRKIRVGLAAGIAISAAAIVAHAAGTTHWGYGIDNGPKNWSAMSSEFKLCSSGRHQSPVDIPAKASALSRHSVTFDYTSGPASVVNNGHSIQVNVAQGSSMTIDGTTYRLLQFHFHTPSENTVDGLHYPMETHLVHSNDAGHLAVVSVMVRRGAGSFLDRLPRPGQRGAKAAIKQVNAADVLPATQSFKTFSGSLTTPPCSEGVTWIVMNDAIEASEQTIADFYAILGANNRPTHPLNGRRISAAN